MTRKAVILAAGWGSRLRPLTCNIPKPAIRLLDRTLLEHNLYELSGLVDEVIVVVGYKREVIKEIVGDEFCGMSIRYVRQEEQLGTGHAARMALPFLDEEFLVLNGDDLYFREDIENCLKRNPSILVKEMKDPSGYGQVSVKSGRVAGMVEKPETPVSNLVNIGCYNLNKDLFRREIEKSERGEFEIVDYLRYFVEDNDLHFALAKRWYPVTYPWNILFVTEELLREAKEKREGVVEEGAVMKGKVIMEKGSQVKNGSVIEGPVYIGKNSVIESGARVTRNSSIHDSCMIESGARVEGSVIFSGTKIREDSVIRNSVIGKGCVLEEGVSLPKDSSGDSTVKMNVKGKLIDTKRMIGGILGDGVVVGGNISLEPGMVAEEGSMIKDNKKKRCT